MLLSRYTNENNLVESKEEENEKLKTDLSWVMRVKEEKAKRGATLCKGKAPGADGVTVSSLQVAWSDEDKAMRNKYEGSLRYRHFPAICKIAEVILLLKSNRDLSAAKGL